MKHMRHEVKIENLTDQFDFILAVSATNERLGEHKHSASTELSKRDEANSSKKGQVQSKETVQGITYVLQ